MLQNDHKAPVITFNWYELIKTHIHFYTSYLEILTKNQIGFYLGCNVLVNSKPENPPWATPGDSDILTAQRVGFSPSFLCPGGQGFEFEKFSTLLKEKCRNVSICLKKNSKQLKKLVFLCSFMSIFAKVLDIYCIFDKINHFGHCKVIHGSLC